MKRILIVLALLAVTLPCFAQQVTVSGRKDGFNCIVPVSAAVAITAACSSVAPNRPMWITDIQFGTSAAAGVAVDSFPTLKYGTGTTCGTGTTVFWQALTVANSTVVVNLSTPIKIPAGNDVCWIMTTAGSKTIQIQGFYE